MNNICCFCGHSKIYDSYKLAESIKDSAKKIILQENISEFWVGNYGGFDKLCASVINELKSEYPNIKLNLILPYLTQEILKNKDFYNKRFDNIILAELPEYTPKKYSITECNKYMLNHSRFVICYITHDWGGAYQTLKYAKRKNLTIINIGKV